MIHFDIATSSPKTRPQNIVHLINMSPNLPPKYYPWLTKILPLVPGVKGNILEV